MDPTKDNSDFAGPMNGRAFGTSGFSRLGKTLNEQRQAESEQRGVREGVQNFKRMERMGRRAYRDALRSGNSMGAFQVLQEMDKGGFSSGGIRQAGAVENRLMSQFENRRDSLSFQQPQAVTQGSLRDRQTFAQDLNRSALIQSGDEGALQRAYDRGAGVGVGRDAIDRYLGRDATTAPAGSAAPAAPAQPSTWAQATGGSTTPAPGSLLRSPQPGLPVPSFAAGQASTPTSLPQGSTPQAIGGQNESSTPLADRLRAFSEASSLMSDYQASATPAPAPSSGFASTQFQSPPLSDALGKSFLSGGIPTIGPLIQSLNPQGTQASQSAPSQSLIQTRPPKHFATTLDRQLSDSSAIAREKLDQQLKTKRDAYNKLWNEMEPPVSFADPDSLLNKTLKSLGLYFTGHSY